MEQAQSLVVGRGGWRLFVHGSPLTPHSTLTSGSGRNRDLKMDECLYACGS